MKDYNVPIRLVIMFLMYRSFSHQYWHKCTKL